MSEHVIDIPHGDTTLKCFIATPGGSAPAPAVLIFHQWSGRSEHEETYARYLAKLGYMGVAVDLYGDGQRGSSQEENQALMQPFLDDRQLLRDRMLAVLNAVAAAPDVDASRLAACGFCFGGLCAIDLARAGADVAAVGSFHGLLNAPGLDKPEVKATIAIYHGWDDPMAPPEDVVAIGKELSARHADWYLIAHGDTVHAFTHEEADAKADGMAYDAAAARRSWHDFTVLLADKF
ncbi:MAG: dienelactone hydrolase family protein [Pseudomonadota bacterium]